MAKEEKPPLETRGDRRPDPDYQPPSDRQMPEIEAPVPLANIDEAIRKLQESIGSTGLTELEEKITRLCVAAFGDTQFTVAQLCCQIAIPAEDACECMHMLHEIGIVRCPVNDGGQKLYQVMPAVVHPKGIGAGVRF